MNQIKPDQLAAYGNIRGARTAEQGLAVLAEYIQAKQAEAWEAGFRARAEGVRFSEGPYAAALAPTAEPEHVHTVRAGSRWCITCEHNLSAPTAEEAKPEPQLRRCSECGGEFGGSPDVCPLCGQPYVIFETSGPYA